MKTIIVDEKAFKENPTKYLNTLREFAPDETEETMLRTLNNRESVFCFVFDDNDLVVSWARGVMAYNRQTIYIIRQVETKEEFKGKGYAGLCYTAIEEYLSKQDKAKRIITFVDDENISSIKFHEKMGYTRVEPSKYLKDLYGWENAYMYEKEIEIENENHD